MNKPLTALLHFCHENQHVPTCFRKEVQRYTRMKNHTLHSFYSCLFTSTFFNGCASSKTSSMTCAPPLHSLAVVISCNSFSAVQKLFHPCFVLIQSLPSSSLSASGLKPLPVRPTALIFPYNTVLHVFRNLRLISTSGKQAFLSLSEGSTS